MARAAPLKKTRLLHTQHAVAHTADSPAKRSRKAPFSWHFSLISVAWRLLFAFPPVSPTRITRLRKGHPGKITISNSNENKPLDTLWYTRCPVPTGLGIALQKGWLEESFSSQCTTIQSLRESNDKAVRE